MGVGVCIGVKVGVLVGGVVFVVGVGVVLVSVGCGVILDGGVAVGDVVPVMIGVGVKFSSSSAMFPFLHTKYPPVVIVRKTTTTTIIILNPLLFIGVMVNLWSLRRHLVSSRLNWSWCFWWSVLLRLLFLHQGKYEDNNTSDKQSHQYLK